MMRRALVGVLEGHEDDRDAAVGAALALGLTDVGCMRAQGRRPGRELLDAARERGADLLVLGAPRASGTHLLHGETGRAALDGAPWPILVVRGEVAPGPPRTIGVGFDGSSSARAAVALADALAQEHGAALTVVTAWQTLPGSTTEIPEVAGEEAERAARDRLAAALADLPPRTAGLVLHGTGRAHLRALSEKVDLLVVGSGDHGRLRRVLAGSTADALMHEAACPVLAVPTPATAPDDATAAAVPVTVTPSEA